MRADADLRLRSAASQRHGGEVWRGRGGGRRRLLRSSRDEELLRGEKVNPRRVGLALPGGVTRLVTWTYWTYWLSSVIGGLTEHTP
jgi:hypothetical protein